MADYESVVKLRDRATDLLLAAEKARGDFDSAAESSELDAVRMAFREQLSPQWSKLDIIIDDETAWSELDEKIKLLESFTETFQQIILHPRRTQLERQLRNSFITSNEKSIPWDLFLRNADDRQMDNIQDLVKQITDPRLDEKAVQELWNRWVAYQLVSLIEKEKSEEILSEWLLHLVENLGEAQGLDQFIRNEVIPTTETDSQPIVHQIRLKWLDELRAKLENINQMQHQLGLDDITKNAAENWRSLQKVLAGLAVSSRDLTRPEAALIQRKLDYWQDVNAESIYLLGRNLDKLSNIKHVLHSTPQLFEDVPSLSQPSIASIDELLKDRPTVPKADDNKTVQSYFTAYNDFYKVALVWREDLGEETEHLLNRTVKWGRLVDEPAVESEVKAIQELLSNEISLDQLAESHNRFLVLRSQVQETLKTQLSSAEERVLTAILEKEAIGQARVSVMELDDEIALDDLVVILASLVKKEIVHIEVSTRDE